MRFSRLAPAGLAVLVLALADCSSSSTHGTAASSTTTKKAAGGSASAPPTASASPAPTFGTDVSGCTTGRCEVQVSASTKITFKPGLDIDTLRVVSVDEGSGIVTIDTTSSSNTSGGGAYGSGGTCSTIGTDNKVTNKMSVDCLITNNSLSMTVESISGSSAVLKLAPVS